jgi:hypothetical protein
MAISSSATSPPTSLSSSVPATLNVSSLAHVPPADLDEALLPILEEKFLFMVRCETHVRDRVRKGSGKEGEGERGSENEVMSATQNTDSENIGGPIYLLNGADTHPSTSLQFVLPLGPPTPHITGAVAVKPSRGRERVCGGMGEWVG